MSHNMTVERFEVPDTALSGHQPNQGTTRENGLRRKILVVDDEEDIRLMLSDILGLHYRVETAVDGIDALEQIAAGEGDFDLVMTDLRMPRLDGSELTARILADHPDLDIIMMSAHGTITEAVGALKKGVFDYVTKPLPRDLQEVYLKCERYFQSRDLDRRQTRLQEEIHNLSRFPRSNPHFVARASVVENDILLRPGNAKTATLFGAAAAGEAEQAGHYLYSQGRLNELFPPDYREILERINGTDEVIEVDRVSVGDRHYRHTYTPFVDNRAEIFVNITDITPQVENEQLRMMLEAGMEHEFKNLLSRMTPNAELLYHGMIGPLTEQQKASAHEIVLGGQKLLESLNERLEFSRAYSGSLQLQRMRVDLYQIVAECFDGMAAVRADAELKIEGKPYDPARQDLPSMRVKCDPQFVARVFNNLVSNALKYSEWVDVALTCEPEQVLVTVTDGGQGLSPDDAVGIWSLGYRASNRTGNRTGIGLPYSKLIVEAHGGSIGVQCTEGDGCEFFFTLPGGPETADLDEDRC